MKSNASITHINALKSWAQFTTLSGQYCRNLSDNTLANILQNHKDEFTVVLAHEPQYFSNYSGEKVDLVMSGHAHGGQFRLPFIGGVVAPD